MSSDFYCVLAEARQLVSEMKAAWPLFLDSFIERRIMDRVIDLLSSTNGVVAAGMSSNAKYLFVKTNMSWQEYNEFRDRLEDEWLATPNGVRCWVGRSVWITPDMIIVKGEADEPK